MDKSQLRKLTQDFANGELDEDEFRRVRTKLIDDIAEGRITIVREPMPKPLKRPQSSEAPVPTTPSTASIKPIYVGIGVIVLGALVWGVYPRKAEHFPTPTATTAPEISNETKAPGPGERLVKEFIKSNS